MTEKNEEGEGGKGELRRDVKTARETSADFGVAPMEDDDDDFQIGQGQVRTLHQYLRQGI